MKKTVTVATILLACALLLAGCGTTQTDTPVQPTPTPAAAAETTPPAAEETAQAAEPIVIDLSAGNDSPCFVDGREIFETLSLEVMQKGETVTLEFEGATLSALLAKLNIESFTQIELEVSDMDEPVDITEMALAEAGVFLAWSESGEAETPMRVFPMDAETGNLLTRNVTAIIIK